MGLESFNKIPPEVSEAQERIDDLKGTRAQREALYKAGKRGNEAEMRLAEEKLGEAMLTPVQKEMAEDREKSFYPLLERALEKANLSSGDLDRIRLKITGSDGLGSGESTLSGTILGKKSEGEDQPRQDHEINIKLTWLPPSRPDDKSDYPSGFEIQDGSSVDGKPVDKELARKIVEKYFKVVSLKYTTEVDPTEREKLEEESRPYKLADDLL